MWMPKMTASASGASSNDTKVSFISITIPVAIRNLCSQPCHHTPLARCVSSSLSLSRAHTLSFWMSLSLSVPPYVSFSLISLSFLASSCSLHQLKAEPLALCKLRISIATTSIANPMWAGSRDTGSTIDLHELLRKILLRQNPSLHLPRWSGESLWRNPLNSQPYVRTYLITYLPTFLPTYSEYIGPSRFNRPVTAQLPVTTYPLPANSY